MDFYEQNLSDVTLNERRLKQLDQIFIEELQEIKEDMKYQKKGNLSGKYVEELYIVIRMKMIKSLMYDINKKFHISYMGIFNMYCF